MNLREDLCILAPMERPTRMLRNWFARRAGLTWRLVGLLLAAAPGPARAYTAYVTNERDNTVSVVDLDQMKTVQTVRVGQRPRGITMTKDGREILVEEPPGYALHMWHGGEWITHFCLAGPYPSAVTYKYPFRTA